MRLELPEPLFGHSQVLAEDTEWSPERRFLPLACPPHKQWLYWQQLVPLQLVLSQTLPPPEFGKLPTHSTQTPDKKQNN